MNEVGLSPEEETQSEPVAETAEVESEVEQPETPEVENVAEEAASEDPVTDDTGKLTTEAKAKMAAAGVQTKRKLSTY